MGLFLRRHRRHKNGKDHSYWSIVENSRSPSGKVLQRQVIYLGELTQAQHQAWEALATKFSASPPPAVDQPTLLPVPSDPPPAPPTPTIQFSDFSLHHPRQWGACWIADRLWRDLHLDAFWKRHLPPSREGTDWTAVLQTLVTYRLIDPGSEFRLHRDWFSRSAMADILGDDPSLAAKDNLYRCLDRLLEHRESLFGHLQARWKDLFGAELDVVLNELTSS